jgi:hypothetical protein
VRTPAPSHPSCRPRGTCALTPRDVAGAGRAARAVVSAGALNGGSRRVRALGTTCERRPGRGTDRRAAARRPEGRARGPPRLHRGNQHERREGIGRVSDERPHRGRELEVQLPALATAATLVHVGESHRVRTGVRRHVDQAHVIP